MLPFGKPTSYLLSTITKLCRAVDKESVSEALFEGIRKFAGLELLSISEEAEDTRLDIDFNCFVYAPIQLMSPPKNWSRTAGLQAGAGHQEYKIGGKTVEGGNETFYTLGFLFTLKLVIDGKTVLSDKYVTLPDQKFMSKTWQIGNEFPSIQYASERLFDSNAISCTNNLFAQMMGIPMDTIHKTEMRISKDSYKEIQAAESAICQINSQLESAVKDESLSELMNTSCEELYRCNQEIIDSYVQSMIASGGQQETLSYIYENYADLIPIPELVGEIIGSALDTAMETTNA
ncbi:hypothetical protein P4S64_21200 [Vibrio sp. M60_M31a]